MKLEDIPESCLVEEFVRLSAGPGGQHVNRTESSVRLHFRLQEPCLELAPDFRARLCRLANVPEDAEEIVILAKESRSLKQNREQARIRLNQLLLQASVVPKKRRPTKPTHASVQRRLARKAQRSRVKRERSGHFDE